jgi:HK97 family phage prohead protease
MPYFITDKAEGCDGWATVKEAGEVIGCHTNKQDAIDQMIAVSLAEGIEPGGERALPDNYRPALADDVPGGRACGNCAFYNEEDVQGDKAWCERWDDYVSGAYYCNAWQPREDDSETRIEINLKGYAPTKEKPKMAIEYRQFQTEIRAEGEDGHTFTGYAAIFNSEAEGLSTREIIKPGAFSKSVAAAERGEWEVKALQDHDPKYFLGSTKTGTLEVREDDRGLKVRVSLNPEVTFASDLAAMLRRDGAAMGMSFGFSVPRNGDSVSDNGVRELRNIRLHEVSLLTGNQPAYPATIGLGAVRSLSERTEIDASTLMRAFDALLAGAPDADSAATLDLAIRKISPDLRPEPETTTEPEEADDRLVPLSVRERQLALARLEQQIR